MGQTLANVDAVLKEFYEGDLRRLINNEVLLFSLLQSSSRPWSGRKINFPVHMTRNKGVGARAESGALPTAGNQGTVATSITAAYLYGRFDLTGQTLAASKGTSFIDALSLEMEGLKDDVVNDCSRQSYGDGQGRLCQVAADVNSASALTVHNKFKNPGQNGALYILEGQGIDVGTLASHSAGGSGSVVSVTIAANSGTLTDTITVSASALEASASTHFVFNADAGQEMMGLRSLIEDGTAACPYGAFPYYTASVQGISRATYSKWRSTVLANSGTDRVITSTLIQSAFTSIKKKSGKEPDFTLSSYETRDAFLDQVKDDRRFAAKSFDMGFDALSYNNVDLVVDRHAPYNDMFVWNKEAIKMYSLEDFNFADLDGQVIKNVSGYDRWEGFLKAYCNIGIDRPEACAVIRDILDR